jgi:hypothetical protein
MLKYVDIQMIYKQVSEVSEDLSNCAPHWYNIDIYRHMGIIWAYCTDLWTHDTEKVSIASFSWKRMEQNIYRKKVLW